MLPRRRQANRRSAKVDPARDIVFTWNGTTPACACRMATGLPPIAGSDDLRCDFRRLRHGTAVGPSSMSSPGPGRKCWAAKRRMACWPQPARGRAAGEHTPAVAAAEDLPSGRGGKLARRGPVQGLRRSIRRRCYASKIIWTRWPRADSVGGLDALIARANANARTLRGAWVETTDWVDFLAGDPAIRSDPSLVPNLGRARGGATARPGAAGSGRRNAGNSRRSRRRLRYRCLPAIATGPAHLVRTDGGGPRSHAAHRVARLRLRAGTLRLSKANLARKVCDFSGLRFGQRPDAVRQPRDLPGRRILMDDAVLGGAGQSPARRP